MARGGERGKVQRASRRRAQQASSRDADARNAPAAIPLWPYGVAVCGAALAVYANTLWNGFVWDDAHLIAGNPTIRRWTAAPQLFVSPVAPVFSNYYRPLQALSFLIDYQAWGLNPWGFHLTSLVLHAATAVLLYRVAAQLLRDPMPAAVAALLFAVHPVNTEAVAYLSGRSDVLAALCMLAALSWFLNGRRALSLSAFFLALLARETAMVCVLLIVLVDLTVALRDGEPLRRDLARRASRYLPYAIVLLVYLGLRAAVVHGAVGATEAQTLSLATRLLTMPKAVVGYLGLLAMPVHLHMERVVPPATSPFDPAVLGSMAVLAAIGGIAIAARRSAWPVTFGIAWFVIALLPVSSIFPLATFMAEHWLYVPAMGLFIAVGWGLVRLARVRPWPVLALLALLVGAYAARSVYRNRDWRDPITLYTATLRYAPGSGRALVNLGVARMEAGNNAEARAAFARAIALRPEQVTTSYHAHNNLGLLYLREHHLDDALDEFRRAADLMQNHPAAQTNIARALQEAGRLDEARRAAERAVAINDHYATGHIVLGDILGLSGDLEGARREYLRALGLEPYNADAYANLGSVYLAQGHPDQALEAFRTALRLGPESADTRRNLEEAIRAATAE